MAEIDKDAFLEKYYPLLEKDEPDPGGWGYDKESTIRGRTWQGQSGWRRKHGLATTQWSHGDIRRVFNALLPDGSRREISRVLDHGFRRPGPGDPLWIYALSFSSFNCFISSKVIVLINMVTAKLF